jgi:hypothetical protein
LRLATARQHDPTGGVGGQESRTADQEAGHHRRTKSRPESGVISQALRAGIVKILRVLAPERPDSAQNGCLGVQNGYFGGRNGLWNTPGGRESGVSLNFQAGESKRFSGFRLVLLNGAGRSELCPGAAPGPRARSQGPEPGPRARSQGPEPGPRAQSPEPRARAQSPEPGPGPGPRARSQGPEPGPAPDPDPEPTWKAAVPAPPNRRAPLAQRRAPLT